MPTLFDTKHVRRAFSRAAGSYSAAAALQREIAETLGVEVNSMPGEVRAAA